MFFKKLKKTKKQTEDKNIDIAPQEEALSFIEELESSSAESFLPFQSFTASRAYPRTMAFQKEKRETSAVETKKQGKTSRKDIEHDMQENHKAIEEKKQQRYDQALQSYKKAIDIYPEYSIAYYNRALLYLALKDWDRAFADYNKAIKINDRDPEFYNNRANLYALMDKHSKSLADYNQAIQLFPNYSEAYHNRAQTYMKQGKIDEAILDFKRAISLNPDLVIDFYNLACAYSIKKDTTQALEYLDKAVRKGYKNIEKIQTDTDLDHIRNKPAFEDILELLVSST